MKKFMALALSIVLALGCLAGCGDASGVKAKVIEIGNDVFLVSYATVVAFYNRETKIAQVVGTFSPTTLRHIKEFLRQSGFKAETKKQIMKDYM